ncbi:hypothetical protein Trydic_g3944 [Trypoxylus dichotomus]
MGRTTPTNILVTYKSPTLRNPNYYFFVGEPSPIVTLKRLGDHRSPPALREEGRHDGGKGGYGTGDVSAHNESPDIRKIEEATFNVSKLIGKPTRIQSFALTRCADRATDRAKAFGRLIYSSYMPAKFCTKYCFLRKPQSNVES